MRRLLALLAVFAFGAIASAPARAENAAVDAVPKGVEASLMLVAPDAQVVASPLTAAFDVDPDGLPVVATGSKLALFGATRMLADAGAGPISDFAYMRDGRLLMTIGAKLAALNAGAVAFGPATPVPAMRVRPADVDTAYLFGGADAAVSTNVFLVSRDGRAVKLASLPVAIADVAGDGATTYIAAGGRVLKLAAGKRPEILLNSPDPIVSIALSPQGLFYATAKRVGYLASDGTAYDFFGQGGELRTRGDALYALTADGAHVARFRPIARFDEALGPSALKFSYETPSGGPYVRKASGVVADPKGFATALAELKPPRGARGGYGQIGDDGLLGKEPGYGMRRLAAVARQYVKFDKVFVVQPPGFEEIGVRSGRFTEPFQLNDTTLGWVLFDLRTFFEDDLKKLGY